MEWKYLTVWFAGDDLAPITDKYYGFNPTLMCSVMEENLQECLISFQFLA